MRGPPAREHSPRWRWIRRRTPTCGPHARAPRPHAGSPVFGTRGSRSLSIESEGCTTRSTATSSPRNTRRAARRGRAGAMPRVHTHTHGARARAGRAAPRALPRAGAGPRPRRRLPRHCLGGRPRSRRKHVLRAGMHPCRLAATPRPARAAAGSAHAGRARLACAQYFHDHPSVTAGDYGELPVIAVDNVTATTDATAGLGAPPRPPPPPPTHTHNSACPPRPADAAPRRIPGAQPPAWPRLWPLMTRAPMWRTAAAASRTSAPP